MSVDTTGGGGGGSGERKREADGPPEIPELDAETARVKRAAASKQEMGQAAVDAQALPDAPQAPQPVVGSLVVKYLDVGQGECVLVITPLGKKIMIDCGADPKSPVLNAAPDEKPDAANKRRTMRVAHAVTADDFLGGERAQTLDILILTHADIDHRNLISGVLKGAKIARIYHSARYGGYGMEGTQVMDSALFLQSSDFTPMSRTFQVQCLPTEADRAKGQASLLVNSKAVATGKPTSTDALQTIATTFMDEVLKPGNAIRILREQVNGADVCTVTLLAGDVKRNTYSAETSDGVTIGDGDYKGSNCGSVVTLVEAHGAKFLFMGDATVSTERYVVAQHATRIQGCKFLSIPHHGSAETSSTPGLIAAVRPGNVVVSAGREYSSYSHPRWSAIRRYLMHFAGRGLAADANNTVTVWPGESLEEQAAPKIPAKSEERLLLGIQSATEISSPVPDRGKPVKLVVGFPVRLTGIDVRVPPPARQPS